MRNRKTHIPIDQPRAQGQLQLGAIVRGQGKMAAKFKIAGANGPGGSWPKTWNILVNSFCWQAGEKWDMDITRWREDMDFIFEWWKQYFTNERTEWVKYCFRQKKIKFISSSHRVIFFLLYRFNAKSGKWRHRYLH